MNDALLFSPRRIWRAFWLWLWWCCTQDVIFPFWYFMRFEERPTAREQCGHEPDIWYLRRDHADD